MSKRVLSLVLAFTMILGSFSFVAAETDYADHWAAKDIEYLMENDIIKGFPDGSFKPGNKVTRAQLATIINGALKLTDAAEIDFSDVNEGAWYYDAIAIAVEAGYMDGYPDGTMNPNGDVKRQEAAKMFVEAFGVEESEAELDFNDADKIQAWAVPYVKSAVAAGLMSGHTSGNFAPLGTLIRAEAARMTINALGIDLDEAEELEVVSVSAINATQVEVKFSGEVDKTAAETTGNYALGGNNPASASLAADGKTVILTFGTAAEVEVTNAVFVIEPIEDANNEDIESAKYSTIFTYKDTVKPMIVSVKSVTNGTIANSATITFSEPIDSGTIKINGVDQAYTAGTSEITITGLNLNASNTHTLEVVNLTDKAGTPNVTAYATMNFTVTVDNAKPVVQSVVPYSDTSVLVTFDKSMDTATVSSTNIKVRDELLNELTISGITALPNSSTQFVIQLDKIANSNFYQTLNTRNLTIVFNASIEDSVGNTITAVNKTVSLTKDTTKPAVVDIVVNKSSTALVSIVVKYNKNLDAGTVAANDLVIVNQNGVLRTGSTYLNAGTISGKEVTFTFSSQPTGDTTWSVTAPAALVQDTALTPNTSTAMSKSLNLSVGTGAADTITFDGTVTQTDNNTIVVDYAAGTFGGLVKGGAVSGSATNPSNYSINNVVLPSNTTIVLDANQQEATITLPEGFLVASDAAAIFRINNVQTTTNLLFNPVVMTVVLDENTPPTATIPTASGLNNSATRLVITFSEKLDGVANAADIESSFSLTGTGTISSAIYDEAAKTVTFTLASVANGDVLKANASTLVDAAGNEYVPENIIFSTSTGIWSK